jgi:hypothetical protein
MLMHSSSYAFLITHDFYIISNPHEAFLADWGLRFNKVVRAVVPYLCFEHSSPFYLLRNKRCISTAYKSVVLHILIGPSKEHTVVVGHRLAQDHIMLHLSLLED